MHLFPLIRSCLIAILLWALPSVHAQPIRPSADRLDAIVSYPLIIPIVVKSDRLLRTGVITKLDDGRTMHSSAFWIGLSPAPAPNRWTSASGIWTATDQNTITKLPKDQRPLGSWFISIPIPIDAVGQGLWIAGERYELNWLSDPQRSQLEAQLSPDAQSPEHTLEAFWSLKLDPEALNDPAVTDAIDQYAQNPFQSWHARLLTDGLDPHLAHSTQDQSLEALELELAMDTPGNDLLRQLARQEEARWQIILGRIWLTDPQIAFRLKAQLLRTARFGKRTLPLWAHDGADLPRLAHDLLSPFIDDQMRALRANAWLESQPRALTWITDDQGQIEIDSGRFLPTISVVSLPQTAGSSLFQIDSPSALGSLSPELSPAPASIAIPLSIAIDPIQLSPSNPMIETQPVRVRTGRWSSTEQVLASPTPARAPYVRIGPLLNDWTMNALLNNHPMLGATPTPSRSSVGILRRTSTPSRSRPHSGWQLYFELASPDPQSPLESFTLWTGPFNNPFAIWTITPDGRITLVGGSRLNIDFPTVQTRLFSDRWIAVIGLPAGVFDDEHILQLGIERTDAENTHSAWPRRMIPDQPEPGRLAIEADKFDQLKP